MRKICDEYSIPFSWDEIQTYCRIGSWFASGYYGVEPGMICRGKGLGSGLIRNILKVKPPFTINKEQRDGVIEVIAEALKASI